MMPLRLLIIEDSESDAALAVNQLENAGYAVMSRQVEDQDQLKSALENQNWDIIIADFQLPEFNAPAALACLQESGLDIPFIVVSGAIGEETAVSLMKSGACDYLMKGKLTRLGPVVERELSEAKVRRDRKRAEKALQESERNLLNSQRIAHIGHWVMQPQTGEAAWSDEMCRIFGIDPENFDGNVNEIWRKAVHPDDFERVLAASDVRNEKTRLKHIEYRIIRPDGTLGYILAIAGDSIKDSTGKITQLSGVVQDITDRKQAEIALLQKMEESQQRARELEMITSVSSSMRQAETRTELVKIVLQELMMLINAQQATLAFLNGNTLTFNQALGSSKAWRAQKIPVHNDLFGEVIHTGQPVFMQCPGAELHNTLPDWIFKFFNPPNSLIIYPLKSGSNPIGLIYLGFEQQNQFEQEQRNLVAAVADIAGNALNRMSATEELELMVNRRERELESIYQVTSSASETLDMHQALQQALVLTLEAVNTASGAIYLLDESEPVGHPELIVYQGVGQDNPQMFLDPVFDKFLASVVRKKKAVVIPDIESNLQPREMSDKILSFAGLPMRIKDRVIGILTIVREGGEQVILEEMTLLSFIADHLALVIENTRLYKRAEYNAVLDERSRLARDLHDSVTQSLFSANLHIAGAQKYAKLENYPKVDSTLNQIGKLTQQALNDLRLMVYELRASEEIQQGLVSALYNRLEAVENRANINVETDLTWLSRLPERIEENLYRIAIEALNNSLKHARASKVRVEFKRSGDHLLLAIQDNGVGFNGDKALLSGGYGMTTMHQRTDRIGGLFHLISNPGEGTRIEVKFPLLEYLEAKEGS